jgi:hypothetical protein
MFNNSCFGSEISIISNNIEIVNEDITPSFEDNTDYGNLEINSYTIENTYFIKNVGEGDLRLNNLTQKIRLEGSLDFRVSIQPSSSIVPVNGTSSFQISFKPSSEGIKTAIVNVENNDEDENPYTFTIQGVGINPCPQILNLASPSNDETGSKIFKAAQNINATNKVSNTGQVTMKSGKSISLFPGFSVERGAIFRAEVSGCP